ncbi:Amino acid/polyamine transporter I [Cinara cedri]|uniref:b(0,+)-type amino acid transporter 1 n=1 Tax=Cinara cedri TaxID=506608 RepID=A0A5E4N4G7_9HEMI|nr:Amino acid/polyamine transporter I [Cinara cedri]
MTLPPAPKTAKLNRELGLFSASCLIVSLMIGSGIFVSAANALKNTGSVGMCLVIWTLCGVLSLLGALSFAELSTVVPKSGGMFSFYQCAFSDLHRFWGPLPSFVYSWVRIMYLRPAEVAITCLTCAEYSVRPFGQWLSGDLDTEFALKRAVSIAALCVVTLVNYSSVKCFVNVQNVFTTCKVLVCTLIIIGGLRQLCLGNTVNLMTGFDGTTLTLKTFPIAFYSGLWAYEGWMASAVVVEEIKNPHRNVLLSIAIAVPFVTATYVLMNVSYMTVLSVSEMISTPALVVEFGNRALGNFAWFGWVVSFGVAITTFGCSLSIQFEATRLCFASSREGQFPAIFSYVSVKRLTPAPAVFLQGLLAGICILCGDAISLIEFASFLCWMFYGFAMLALLVLRRTKPNAERPFKIPIIVPIFVLVASVFLFLTPIFTDPRPRFLVGLALVLSAVLIYIPFVYFNYKLSVMDDFTAFVEKLLGVAPPESDEPSTDMAVTAVGDNGQQQSRF